MENQVIEMLPAEVAKIAEGVSVEKRTEVQTVLNQVFNGVAKMREQLNGVHVQDENDRVNMKLANTIRLGVRQVRLDAEKVFDAKRQEVQAQMLSYKTEDQLWLKAKQTMQILTKEIEEQARFKEETRQRYEAEQHELKIQQRMVQVSRFAPEIARAEFEGMGDDSFAVFLSGLEKAHNERLEAQRKAEQERIEREKAEAEERERVRQENERLKAEAEARERQLAQERAKAEAERKAIEEKARKEREEAERKAAEERAKQEAILKAEREANAKLEAELKAKAEAEERARKEAEAKAAAELKAKQEAERKAKAAPDKDKLMAFAERIDDVIIPGVSSPEAIKAVNDAMALLAKVSKFVRDKAEAL
jgi:hypothetical protein